MKFHFVDDAVGVDLCPDVKHVRNEDLKIGLENLRKNSNTGL